MTLFLTTNPMTLDVECRLISEILLSVPQKQEKMLVTASFER